jgi:hypothetical protein
VAYRRMKIPGSVVRGRVSYPLSLTVLSFGVMAALGTTAALAVCASPATQLTSGTGTTETGTVTFSNLNNGSGYSVTVGGLGLTCTSTTNSSPVAGFFASLSNGSTGGSLPAGCSRNGSLSGWTSAAASGNSVTFTSVTPNSNVADLSVSGNPSSAVEVQGSPSLSSSLSLNTVCVGSAGNWQNQEYHAGTGSGSIIDWKLGAPSPTNKDPTATIGTWSLSGNTVVYNYTGAGSFSFTVWQQTNGSLDFCSGASTVVNGTVKAGQSACP